MTSGRERLYSDATGKPVMRESTVAFLDLLGTTQRMSSFSSKDLQSYLGSMARAREEFYVDDGPGFHELISFSDNIAIGTPFDPEWHDRGLAIQVFSVQHLQMRLTAIDGVLLRGGIAQGPLFIDSRVVIGQGLVDAYNLEQGAEFPRVVIGTEVVPLLAAESMRWSEPRESTFEDTIVVDRGDDTLMVNYMSAAWDGVSSIKEVRPWLQKHRTTIRDGLRRHRGAASILRKFVWAAQYHNWICHELHQRRYEIADPAVQGTREFTGLITYLDEQIPDWRATIASGMRSPEA